MFPAIALSLLAAIAPRFGPELTFADLRPAPPNAFEVPVGYWNENGTAVAVILRYAMNTAQVARVRLRADGSADPSSIVPLHVDAHSAVAARAGDGTFAVWAAPTGELYASRFDASGAPLTPGGKLIAPDGYLGDLTAGPLLDCGDRRCLVKTGTAAFLLDLDGNLVSALPLVDWVVAGKHGFLVKRCASGTCRAEVLDDDGVVKSSVTLPVHRAVFGDARFVAVSDTDSNGNLKLWSVDPATGVWSDAVTIARMPGLDADTWIAWNGSMYALSMKVTAKPPPFPAGITYKDWLGTLRLDGNFVSLDASPVKLIEPPEFEFAPRVVGAGGGFFLLPYEQLDYRQRAYRLANDGTITSTHPRGTPVFDGLGSQFAQAASSSRDAILGVWAEEVDFDRYALRA